MLTYILAHLASVLPDAGRAAHVVLDVLSNPLVGWAVQWAAQGWGN